jgi:hypothetical protein
MSEERARYGNEIRPGDVLEVACTACGGPLLTERLMTTIPNRPAPEDSEHFWSASCRRCATRYDYVPDTRTLWRLARVRP